MAAFGFLPALRRPALRPGVPMRLRLLGRLNSPFSRDPGAVLALRPRSPGGLRWRIDRRTLTVSRPGLPDLAVPLEGSRIVDVRDRLAAEGVEIAFHAGPAVLDLGALALLPGEGDQDESDGDHIHAFTAPLWGLKGAKGRWLEEARDDLPLALREMVVKTSTGRWSDLWASYFDILRRPGETDAHQNMRTAYEWRRPRSNRFAIAKNIKVLHGREVWVREPWREMFTLSEPGNDLSGGHHLPNATEFCYHWAQLRSLEFEDWAPLQAEAEADRPAGTLLLAPVGGLRPRHLEFPQDRGIAGAVHDVGHWPVRDYDGHILDFNCSLSDTYVLLNPSMSIFDSQIYEAVNDRDPGSFFPVLTVCKGEIVLSEAPPLGDLQAHLAGGRLVREDGAPMELSGAAGLSDHEWRFGWDPIDEWFEAVSALAWAGAPSYPVQRLGGVVERRGAGVDAAGGRSAVHGNSASAWVALPRAYDRGWRGRWDDRKWTAAGYPLPVVSGQYSTEVLTNAFQSIGGAQATLRPATALLTKTLVASSAGGQATLRPASALSTSIRLAAQGQAQASRAQAFLTTGAEMLLARSGQASLLGAPLTTSIRLASQGAADGTLAAAAFSTGIRMASLGQGQASATINFGVGAALASTRAGQAAGTLALSTSIRLAASRAGQASGQGTLDTGIRFAVQGPGQASRVAAALSTGIRLASQNAGQASLLAATSLTTGAAAPSTYDTANLVVWMDPDSSANRTLVSGRYDQLRDARGTASESATAAVAGDRPSQVAINGRSAMSHAGANGGNIENLFFDGLSDQDNDSGGLYRWFSDMTPSRTYTAVFRTPAAWPTVASGVSILPIVGSWWWGLKANQRVLGLTRQDAGSNGWRPTLLHSDVSANLQWKFPASGSLAANTVYEVVWRITNGVCEMWVNGAQQTMNNTSAIEQQSIAHPTARGGSIGYAQITDASSVDCGMRGEVCSVLVHDVALSTTRIAANWAVTQARWMGAASSHTLLGSEAPAAVETGDTASVVLGTKIRTSRAGKVTALRYYKGDAAQTVTTLRLWSGTTQIASVAAPSGTAVGWVEVALPASVDIAAGLYVVSYHTTNGRYAVSTGYFGTARTSGPLTGPQSGGADGGNGLFLYTGTHTVPTDTFNASSYLADIRFE